LLLTSNDDYILAEYARLPISSQDYRERAAGGPGSVKTQKAAKAGVKIAFERMQALSAWLDEDSLTW
jgi:hypothetical protein